MYHNPVLLKESVDGLSIKENGVYVDVTFGGGGHSKEILKRLGVDGKLFAFDQDEDAQANTLGDKRFVLIGENFRYITQFLKFYGIRKVDGILADYGVSSHQFDKAERGFSTRFDADLDMRMSKRNELSAYDVVNTYSYDDLRNPNFGLIISANRHGVAIKMNNARARPWRFPPGSGCRACTTAHEQHQIGLLHHLPSFIGATV